MGIGYVYASGLRKSFQALSFAMTINFKVHKRTVLEETARNFELNEETCRGIRLVYSVRLDNLQSVAGLR